MKIVKAELSVKSDENMLYVVPSCKCNYNDLCVSYNTVSDSVTKKCKMFSKFDKVNPLKNFDVHCKYLNSLDFILSKDKKDKE